METLLLQEAEYEGEVLDSLEELDTIEELEAALQDYYDSGMGFNTVVVGFSIANHLLFCCNSVLIYNKFVTLDVSGNQILNQLQQY